MAPSYIAAYKSGLLSERITQLEAVLRDCTLCPRSCRVDRRRGEQGDCEVGAAAEVASAGPHFGEEAPLVGRHGSGTIFLSSCNLRCTFCQNFDISHEQRGRQLSPAELSSMMLSLQKTGCHNINFVTPSHQVPAILRGLAQAAARGLRVPLVYNTSGYDAVETIRLLDGIFDIYMPDLKTLDAAVAKKYMNAPDYPEVVKAALIEMHRQVGDLQLDDEGIAQKGILLRHLVMPDDLATTQQALEFLRDRISPNTYVNIMAQYHSAGRTDKHPEIDRRITTAEYQRALDIAAEVGINRLDERRPKLFLFSL